MAIRVLESRDPKDKRSIYRFLYQLWSGGQTVNLPGIDHKSKIIKDELDEWARHFIAVDEIGRIVGCVRMNRLSDDTPPESLFEQMHFDKLTNAFDKRKVSMTSNLAVEQSERGSQVSSLLLAAMMRIHQKEEILVSTTFCPLGLLHFYYSIGYRPYGKKVRLDTGVRVPLVLTTCDMAYFRQIDSPLLSIIDARDDDKGLTAGVLKQVFKEDFENPGFDKSSSQAVWAGLAYSSPEDDEAGAISLFSGLSKDDLYTAMQHVTKVEFAADEVIYRRGERESGMGLLIKGSLGVSLDNDIENVYFVAVIKPGETFGEMQAFGQGARTANVIALEPSEVMLLPGNILELVSKKNPNVALKLAENLLRTLTTRLTFTNKLLSTLSKGKKPDVRVRQETLQKSKDDLEIKARVSGYHFNQIADQVEEIRQFELEAIGIEKYELPQLSAAGLAPKMAVLDVGGGPGIFARTLADHAPESVIIGLEENIDAIERATELLDIAGLQRCRFVQGAFDHFSFDRATFDFSYARYLLHRVKNPTDTLFEMARVTKPGGIVSAIDIDDKSLLLHPRPEKAYVKIGEKLLQAQKQTGADLHVGRKLHTYFNEVGLEQIRVMTITLTTAMMHAEEFLHLALWARKRMLMDAKLFDAETERLFMQLESAVSAPKGFGSANLFFIYGVVAG